MNRIIIKLAFAFCILTSISLQAQTTVFNADFTTSQGASYTSAAGPIGSSTTWSMNNASANLQGAKIDGGQLTLSTDLGTGTGAVFAYTPVSNFTSPYNATLNSNTGLITWSFNMRQIRTDPSGWGTGSYAAAVILGATSVTALTAGTGYAVTYGQSGATDPINLVKYTGGLRAGTVTNILTSNTTGLADFGAEYLSIKVTFNPASQTWELFVRNDGTTAFTDPATGMLTSQGTIVDNTYSNTAMPYMGAAYNVSSTANQTAFFDNLKITLGSAGASPTISSTSPAAGCEGTVITISGTNLSAATGVTIGGVAANAFTVVSPTTITATAGAGNTGAMAVSFGASTVNAGTFNLLLPPGQPSAIAGPNAMCAGNTAYYSILNDTTVVDYTWTLPSGWSGTSVSDSINVSIGSASGTISVQANNACGASATQTLDVTATVTPANTVTVNQSTISADASGVNYQWIDCANNSLINGAVSQSFTATANGSYAVIVSQNGCADTSLCIPLSILGMKEKQFSTLQITPNPSNGNISIHAEDNESIQAISIIDVLGNRVFQQKYSALPFVKLQLELKPGIYLVETTGSRSNQVRKLIIKD